MKAYQLGPLGTIVAAEALYNNRFVDCLGTTVVDLKCAGVTLFDVADGESATIQMSGIAVVESGGAVTAGNHVSADSSGRAVALTIDNVNDIPKNNGVALDAATAAGEFIRVRLI
jgi:uncharacterized protein DUF2190